MRSDAGVSPAQRQANRLQAFALLPALPQPALSAAVIIVLRYFRLIAIAPRPHIKVRVALTI
jgi:hypothetical protein